MVSDKTRAALDRIDGDKPEPAKRGPKPKREINGPPPSVYLGVNVNGFHVVDAPGGRKYFSNKTAAKNEVALHGMD